MAIKKQHTEMNSISMINIPDDVLINKIFRKLDTISLVNLRCVCKNFRSFITYPDFVKMHRHDQFNSNPMVLLVSGNRSLFYSLNLNGINGTHINPCCLENVNIASGPLPQCPSLCVSRLPCPLVFGSCNGLLCLVEREDSPPSLWNPTTKEFKLLPPPHFSRSSSTIETRHPGIIFGCTRVVTYGIGYDSIIDDYKVIQCENSIYRQYIPPADPRTEYTITNFQVYTLGTDTWRRINDNPYESYFTKLNHSRTPGMFVNGALHWILRENESFGSKIIAFDIEKEMFRVEVPKPHSLSDSSSNDWSLDVLRGCLCIYEGQCRDVWMMLDYGVMDSWTKLFTIEDQSPGFDFKVLKFCENGKVLIAGNSLIVYDPINRNSEKINIEEIPGDICYKEIHIESLVSLNTGRYRGGKNNENLA